MSEAQWKNFRGYVIAALVGAIFATGAWMGQYVLGSGLLDFEHFWRPAIGTFLVALFGTSAAAGYASTLVRGGSEHIAEQVNALRAEGYSRKYMEVSVPEGTPKTLGKEEEVT